MPRPLFTLLACLALAAAGTVAGCGSSNDKSSSTPATTPAATPPPAASGGVVNVAMKNIKMVPDKITVKVGQKITWTNDDGQIAHNVTATSGAKFASDNFTGGKTFSYTPTKVGTIQYECTIHSGQTGTIIVTK